MVAPRGQRGRRQTGASSTGNTASTPSNSTNLLSTAAVGATAQSLQTQRAMDALANAPEGSAFPDPLNFETLPLSALRRCQRNYGLQIPATETFEGYLLRGGSDKQTWSSTNLQRSTRAEAAAAAKQHFMRENIRETETIVEFLYAVQNKDNVFKIQF